MRELQSQLHATKATLDETRQARSEAEAKAVSAEGRQRRAERELEEAQEKVRALRRQAEDERSSLVRRIASSRSLSSVLEDS